MTPSDDTIRRHLTRLVNCVATQRDELLRMGEPALDVAATNEHLAHWLYQAWYLVPHPPPITPESLHLRTNLPALFRAALPSSTRWLTKWVVLEVGPDGACVAGRRGEARELRCSEYANVSRPGVPVMPGDGVAVMECIDWVDPATGFWTTQSRGGHPTAPLIRLYWSVNDAHVGDVLAGVTGVLDELGVKYSLKCPAAAADFARVEPLVVYLQTSGWAVAQTSIVDLARRSEPLLRESVPPLALQIANGVAFAEDPPGHESFGQSRCRMLAPGVAALLKEPRASIERGTALLMGALRDAGIDAARPWLNAPAPMPGGPVTTTYAGG